jgi:ribosome-associated protein
LALKILADHQALEPVLLDVKEHCSFADFFIICSGASKRQVAALAEHLQEELAKVKVKPLGVEGLQEGLWVLMDYNTLVVHIFFQELRQFYDLEGLWADALQIDITPPPAALPPAAGAPEPVQNSGESEPSGHE